MDEEKIINSNRKHNLRIYPLYKMLSWDLLFYYAISFLFLSNCKGFSASQILLAESFYPLFKIIFQIPCTILIDKIGKRNSLIIGNIFIFLYVLFIMGANSLSILILANLFCAIGYVIKGTVETNILFDSIPKTEKRSKIFSKVDGISFALFYVFEAISSIITGFLYVINPYVPMTVCLIFCAIAVIISYSFKHIPSNGNIDNEEEQEENVGAITRFKNYFKGLSSAFKYIFRSGRLRGLILFNAVFSSLLSLLVTLRRSLLNDIGFSSKDLGITFAILGIIAAITAAKTNIFHKKLANKALTYFGLYYTFSLILSGIIVLLDLPNYIMLPLLMLTLILQYCIKGPYYTLIKKYLANFSTSQMRIKISSANYLMECIASTLLTFFSSFLLEITTTAYATVIIGCIFFVTLIIILEYMRTRVGLKPEEYGKNDIEYKELM